MKPSPCAKWITAPILILSYTDPRRAEEIIRYRVTQTVYTWDLIECVRGGGATTQGISIGTYQGGYWHE